jgi:hypothetical protein
MKKIQEFPVGYPLFELKTDSTSQAKSMHGCPWPVEIYYDERYEPIQLKATSDQHLTMQFMGLANGAPTTFTADSGASASFVDVGFAKKQGLTTHSTHRLVTLADSSTVPANARCTLNVKLKSTTNGLTHTSKVTCLVLDLGGAFDVILGEDWLLREKADLLFSTDPCSCIIHPQGRESIHIAPLSTSTEQQYKANQYLTAVQVKRLMRKGARTIWINVIEFLLL